MTETVPLRTAALPSPGGLLRRLGYHALGLPLSLVAFVVGITGFALGVGTLVIWVGVPVLVLTLLIARGLADVERRAVEHVTGRPLLPHAYRPPSGTGLSRLLRALTDPQAWRDLAHAVLGFPLRFGAGIVAVTWAATGVGSLLYVTWEWALPRTDSTGLYQLITGDGSRWADVVSTTVLGALLLATLPLVLRGLTALTTGFARWLLTSEATALRARTERLETSRAAAVQAEATTLRRVERDIHDGPQQRLVRLTMDLEAVSRRLDDDPERARPLVDGALEQSREALAELRAVSRGIAPPILADRGLGPALAAAAARCPVQVSLDVALPDGRRLAPAVENAAYFVVTEALTNVAKHSGATACSVAVQADAQRVLARVVDDGVGGAHAGKGHGLAGLAERLAAVEGALDVTSPAGGPTTVTAVIPLGEERR